MEVVIDKSKRNFLRGRKLPKKVEIRLPWIKSEQAFIDGCTQCGDCISDCAQNIIIKADDGFPKVDFSIDECTFCEKCIDSCEQDLFVEAKQHSAWPAHLNIKDDCLAKQQIYCQSCKDVCEPRAIAFKFIDNAIPKPVIDQDACTSCGACISVCPSNSTELVLKEAFNGTTSKN
ncbi:ferredoxin-type protein NapF [Thalassotalea crassostreae]|uniref:ferredoxin-type protein NapF n=1 Tax=Thalassotalea crassostreae TaxID=1763536 RepID=UPI00083802D4|nr:ferredoxin-type protein NapF [Thalassotalea crassostreae]